MKRRLVRLARPALALVALTLLAGCGRDEVRTYSVAKEKSAPAPASALPAGHPPVGPALSGAAPSGMAADAASADAAMRNTAVTTASGPGLVWTAPAGWSAGPEKPMRKATLLVPSADGGPGAELAVTAFPGDVGGNLANVNRWRQQLGLPPISQAELGGALQHLHVGQLHVDVAELVAPGSPPAKRVIGAIVPHVGATWFFKLEGPDALVAATRPAFLEFLNTLRPGS